MLFLCGILVIWNTHWEIIETRPQPQPVFLVVGGQFRSQCLEVLLPHHVLHDSHTLHDRCVCLHDVYLMNKVTGKVLRVHERLFLLFFVLSNKPTQVVNLQPVVPEHTGSLSCTGHVVLTSFLATSTLG